MGGNEYSLASLWQKLAFKFLLIGFELVILAFATDLVGEKHVEVETLLLLGFLFYLLALVVVVFLIWLSETMEKHPMIWTSVAMALAFLAAIAIIIGIALEGAFYHELKTYSTTFVLAGAFMAIFGGIWLIMELRSHVG